MIMQVVRSGLVVTGVNTHWQTVAVGVIMILAVGVDCCGGAPRYRKCNTVNS